MRIVSKAKMKDGTTGLMTVGVALCVAVGMGTRHPEDKEDQVFGLAHLGCESEPGIIVQMSQEVLAKAKKGSKVSVFLADGARASGGSKSHRDGRTLFETQKTTALNDKRMPLVEDTEDRLLIDNSPVDVTMHEGKGAPGAQMNRFQPKEFLMTF